MKAMVKAALAGWGLMGLGVVAGCTPGGDKQLADFHLHGGEATERFALQSLYNQRAAKREGEFGGVDVIMVRDDAIVLAQSTVGAEGEDDDLSNLSEGQVAMAPPPGKFQQASEVLAGFPDFIEGVGQLWVQPQDVAAGGPFLAYDQAGRLASTVYMVSRNDLAAGTGLDKRKAAPNQVHYVSLVPHAGHPGMPEPHALIVLSHIPENQAARLEEEGGE